MEVEVSPGPSLSARSVPSSTPARCLAPPQPQRARGAFLQVVAHAGEHEKGTGLGANELTVGGR